ncbi:MAG TPA: hypothetical protein VIM64_14305, partial [Puia sp.]
MRLKLIISFILLTIFKGQAQTISSVFPTIDSMYKAYAITHHVPGLVYGIVADGRLIHTGSFG